MRTPTSLRSSIAPVKRHSERHNHQLFSVCFFANLQNTKPSSKEIGLGSMWQHQTVQWADESRTNPVCWLLWELPIKLFSTSATPSALLPPSPLIKSCSIISVLFLQYFLPLSNSDSTCSSNNSPNNNPAILAPQRPHLILGQDDGGGGGDLHQHLGQHLHHSGEQQPEKHHSFQLSLAIIWSLMCNIVHRKLPS